MGSLVFSLPRIALWDCSTEWLSDAWIDLWQQHSTFVLVQAEMLCCYHWGNTRHLTTSYGLIDLWIIYLKWTNSTLILQWSLLVNILKICSSWPQRCQIGGGNIYWTGFHAFYLESMCNWFISNNSCSISSYSHFSMAKGVCTVLAHSLRKWFSP